MKCLLQSILVHVDRSWLIFDYFRFQSIFAYFVDFVYLELFGFIWVYFVDFANHEIFFYYFRIVDPEMALSMLHKQAPKPMLLGVPPSGPPMQPMGADRFHPPPQNFDHGRDIRMDEPRFGGGRDHRDPRDRGDPRDRYPERDHRDRDPRDPRGDPRDPRSHRDRDPRDPRGDPRDPRDRDPRDPRDRGGSSRRHEIPPVPDVPGLPPQIPAALAASDPDKAQLIMQVMQIPDEQIAMLPAEQRQSILQLKKELLGANGPR